MESCRTMLEKYSGVMFNFFFPNFQSCKMKIPFSIKCPLKIFNNGLFSSVMLLYLLEYFLWIHLWIQSVQRSLTHMMDLLCVGCIFRKGFKWKSHCRNLFPFHSLLRNAMSKLTVWNDIWCELPSELQRSWVL